MWVTVDLTSVDWVVVLILVGKGVLWYKGLGVCLGCFDFYWSLGRYMGGKAEIESEGECHFCDFLQVSYWASSVQLTLAGSLHLHLPSDKELAIEQGST